MGLKRESLHSIKKEAAAMPYGTPVDELIAERMGISPGELTQSAVERCQLDALRRTLAYARENSDFYRETLRDIEPDEIQSLADLRRIPFTSEADLAGNEWRFQCISASKISRIVTVPTTGTHGMQKRLSFSEEDIRRSVDFIYRGYLTMHCTPGEKMLVMMSGTAPGSIGDMVQKAMQPLGMEIQVYGTVNDIRDAYEKIMDFKPGVIEGIPWHTAALARYGERYGNPEREFIRSVNLSADLVPDSIISRLNRLWGCTVHRHYGMTEMCIFGGVECDFHRGYHMRPVDLLFEIPEPDADGFGEVVITTLGREAMPLIRYRTGDIGRITTETCGCGCSLWRIEKLFGRRSDLVSIGGCTCFFSEIADALYSFDEVIDFDVALSGGDQMICTVRTLPGEHVLPDAVRETLCSLRKIGPALQRPGALTLLFEETDTFPVGYNLKKKVTVQNP